MSWCGSDMSRDDGVYSALLRLAMFGCVDAVMIGGPTCRTRSELRRRPMTGMPGAGSLTGPWALDELGEVERAKCHL